MKASSREMSAAARAIWLSELAAAIEVAQDLAWQLGVVEGKTEALELYVQLELARAEVHALRGRGGRSRPRDEPDASSAFAAPHPAGTPEHRA